MSTFLMRDPLIPWWVEVHTTLPACQYFFRPFASPEEAEAHQPGYVEDLIHEHALEIVAKITRCQPEVLTLYDEDDLCWPAKGDEQQDASPYEHPTVLSSYLATSP
jgi:hypothetical protein